MTTTKRRNLQLPASKQDSPARNTRSRTKPDSEASLKAQVASKSGNHEHKGKRVCPNEKYPFYKREWLQTISFDECPKYLQDNEFILTGYRSGYSYRQSYLSLFHFHHNESVNVWTHLLGFFLCIYLIVYTWNAAELASLTLEDRFVLTMFLGLHCYTLIFSSLLHLHICVSKDAQTFWSCLDHSGISASIGGGSIALMYLLLHCHGNMRVVWVGLLIIGNCVGVVGPLFPKWRSPSFRVYRSVIDVGSGAAVLAPIFYYIFHEGTSKLPLDLQENFALGYVFLMAFQYVLGAFIYASRIPERYWPGKFDYFLQSHNIWHCLVVSGSVTLWRATIALIEWKGSDLEMCNGV